MDSVDGGMPSRNAGAKHNRKPLDIDGRARFACADANEMNDEEKSLQFSRRAIIWSAFASATLFIGAVINASRRNLSYFFVVMAIKEITDRRPPAISIAFSNSFRRAPVMNVH